MITKTIQIMSFNVQSLPTMPHLFEPQDWNTFIRTEWRYCHDCSILCNQSLSDMTSFVIDLMIALKVLSVCISDPDQSLSTRELINTFRGISYNILNMSDEMEHLQEFLETYIHAWTMTLFVLRHIWVTEVGETLPTRNQVRVMCQTLYHSSLYDVLHDKVKGFIHHRL